MTLNADAAARLAIYQRLTIRNRVVGVLRIAVPLAGVAILLILLAQIYVSSLGDRFSIGRISVSRDSISVEAPQYSGILSNGTTYAVTAERAQAAPGTTNLINLTDASLTMVKLDGVTIKVAAQAALLDTTGETVTIKDIAYVEDSTGTNAIVADSVFDYASQTLIGKGTVSVAYADGTTLDGEGLFYDVKTANWTFSKADVTLPATPGTQTP